MTTDYTIPPRLAWRWAAGFYPPRMPDTELIDRYLTDDTRQKLGRYRTLLEKQTQLREELGECDPNRAVAADEQARTRAFANGQPPPAPTEPKVRAKQAELRATIASAARVLLGALETAGNAILTDQRNILDRIAQDARAEIPSRIRELRDQLGHDLDEIYPLVAAAEWIRNIDVNPTWYPSQQGHTTADTLVGQLIDQLDTRMHAAFGPIIQPEPSLGDIAEHYGSDVAKQYGEQKRRRRTTGWKP